MGLFFTIILAGIVIKYFDEILSLIIIAGAVLFHGTGAVLHVRKEMKEEAAKKQAALPTQPTKKRFWTWKKLAFAAFLLFLIAIN